MSWNASLEKHKQEIEAWTSLCNDYKESLYLQQDRKEQNV